MPSVSFAQIFFAIAMIFLPPGKTSKITAVMGGVVTEWTLRSDGKWHGKENSGDVDMPIGVFFLDPQKQTITIHKPNSQEKDTVTDISTLIEPGGEKPEPATIELLGQAMDVTRNGNDLTLVRKGAASEQEQRKITIHYEQAAPATPAKQPTP